MTEQEWRDNFARQIRIRMRNKLHINQRELAYRSGLSEMTISRYLRGERSPGAREIINLAIALECRTDDLIMFGDFVYF